MNKPTLVCLSLNDSIPPRIARYVPQPTGGLLVKSYPIVDRKKFTRALNPRTIELFRLDSSEAAGRAPAARKRAKGRATSNG